MALRRVHEKTQTHEIPAEKNDNGGQRDEDRRDLFPTHEKRAPISARFTSLTGIISL